MGNEWIQIVDSAKEKKVLGFFVFVFLGLGGVGEGIQQYVDADN